MSILFVNGSPEKKGNTAALAGQLLKGKTYETLNLADHKIYSYGQRFADDEFDMVVEKMKEADTIVIGSPVYWHSMSGAIRNLLDRFYGPVSQGALSGRKLFFIFQGAAPTKEMLEAGEYTMSRFAAMYGMEYMGMASDSRSVNKLAEKCKQTEKGDADETSKTDRRDWKQ